MRNVFKAGDRVRVRRDPHFPPGPSFPAEPFGTVQNYPGTAQPYREIASPTGAHRFYWIEFESPQVDADGDGPYVSAEVNVKYLESPAD